MIGEEGQHSPKNKKEVLRDRPNVENKGERDIGSDPKGCSLGKKRQTGF